MTTKTLYTLLFVFLVGLGLILGRSYFSQYQETKPNAYLQAVQALKPEVLAQITLSSSTGKVSLTKEGDIWKIASKSADPAKVEDLLNALIPKSSPLLIGETEVLKQKQGLSPEKATEVVLQSSGQTITALIGPSHGGMNSVMLNNQPQIYSMNNLPTLSTNANDWVNLTIIDMESEQVKSIAFNPNPNPFTLEMKENGTWSIKDSTQSVNQDSVQQFLMELNPFKAKALAYEQKKLEYISTQPPKAITITTLDNQSTTLEFFPGKDDYLIKRNPDGEYFLVSNSSAEDFNKQVDDFVQPQSTQQ